MFTTVSHSRILIRTFTAAVLVLGIAGTAQSATLFKTDFIDHGTWTETQVGGSGSHIFDATGYATGNGDPSALNIFSYLYGGSTSIGYFLAFDGLVYDPSVQGAVDSIDFSLDRKRILSPYGGHGYGIGALQDGNHYFYGTTVNTINAWGQFVGTGLTSGDFSAFFSAGPGLDLSASGSAIQFGLVIYSGNGGSPERYDETHFDNYSVTLNESAAVAAPVNAPATLALLLTGSVFARRFKRH